MTWATERLEAICSGRGPLPPIVEQLRLGRLDAWGEGWVRKTWTPHPSLDTADGSLFGGYIAALADQALAFAAMTGTTGPPSCRSAFCGSGATRRWRSMPR